MSFTPYTSFLGGLILAASTTSLLASYGRVFGVSGVTHSVIQDAITSPNKTRSNRPSTAWKWSTFGGLIVGGTLLRLAEPSLVLLVGAPVFDHSSRVAGGLTRTIIAGLLVGAGTKLGSGCTSGHMLCGLARLSPRSLAATATFFPTALLTSHLFPSHLSLLSSPSPSFSLPTLLLLLSPFPLYSLLLTPRVLPPRAAELASSFALGVHFACGLALAGMAAPSKVLGFFEVPGLGRRSGAWDASLGVVAVAGLGVNVLGWVGLVSGWARPRWAKGWELPTRRDVDLRLIAGSVLFGVGWGLRGICPGPMLVNLGAGVTPSVMWPFFGAFAAGGWLVSGI